MGYECKSLFLLLGIVKDWNILPALEPVFFFFRWRVFKSESGSLGQNAEKVVESILNFFSEFDAFMFPFPSSNKEVLLNLNREEVQDDIDKPFIIIRGVKEFKGLLFSKLSPKLSFQDGEYLTGDGELTYYEGQLHDELWAVPVIWGQTANFNCLPINARTIKANDTST